jgi:large subunit ribosomal protein L15
MPHRLRKTRKKRGSRTQGYGQIGQHRRSGTKGRKKSSFNKGGWTYVVKYEPNYFGDKGFTSPKSLRQKIKTINVGEVEELVNLLAAEEKLEKKGKTILIDLPKMGYDKLLARGTIQTPLTVKTFSHSEGAAKKIENAGGQILKQAK